MKAPEKLHAVARHALAFGRRWIPKKQLDSPSGSNGAYPSDIVDVIVFHKLHLGLPAGMALRGYRALKEDFVDWNEVRISSVREIQEALSLSPGSLELAVFIKDLLELIHRERQDVSLEFLSEKNLGDIRRYLKQLKGMDNSTVELILRLRKEHPVFPLNSAVETVLSRLGVLRGAGRRSQSEKMLHEMVDPSKALVLHHFLLDHSRSVCPPDESMVDCPRCGIRHMCAFFARTSNKHRRRPPPGPGGRQRPALLAPARRNGVLKVHRPSPGARRGRLAARKKTGKATAGGSVRGKKTQGRRNRKLSR